MTFDPIRLAEDTQVWARPGSTVLSVPITVESTKCNSCSVYNSVNVDTFFMLRLRYGEKVELPMTFTWAGPLACLA
jgi:hypothetical protein